MKLIGLGMLAGVVGFLVAWSAWHLYLDHQNFHMIVNFLNAQVAQAAKAAK